MHQFDGLMKGIVVDIVLPKQHLIILPHHWLAPRAKKGARAPHSRALLYRRALCTSC